MDAPSTPNQAIERFMNEHEYTVPVLRGEDYAHAVGVNEIPTTWFFDAKGGLAFRELDYTPRLIQEFNWRLEAMEGKDRLQVGRQKAASQAGNR